MTTSDRIAAVAMVGGLMYLVVFTLGGRIETVREAHDAADELLAGRIERAEELLVSRIQRVETEFYDIRSLLEAIPDDVRNLPAYRGRVEEVGATLEELGRQISRFEEALPGFNERLVALERP